MSAFSIDSTTIRELAALLEETGLGELEIEEGERRLRISRQAVAASPAPAVLPVAAPAAPAAPAAAPAAAGGDNPDAVTSPMVGTAYLSAEPGAAPFVKVGDSVSAGQTILIIEAMKTFNEIPAPRSGTVTSILVDNGTPVEFGEPLLVIS